MTLPADVARCAGYGATECKTCRRYTDPPHERQVWTGPWELEGVPCEMRIPTQGKTDDRLRINPRNDRPAHGNVRQAAGHSDRACHQ
jgi:hypothetical protein